MKLPSKNMCDVGQVSLPFCDFLFQKLFLFLVVKSSKCYINKPSKYSHLNCTFGYFYNMNMDKQ